MGLTLELSHINKTYNGQTVLADCSYRFASARLYVLMGPNGSGKSTLFRIAALLERPDQGEVKYFAGDELLSHDLALRRRISMVFPRVGVFNRSVYHNAAYGLKIRGVTHAERDQRVLEVLELVGLRHKQDQQALTLSSGETMRLGLARALVFDPDVLFLDEPTTSIDQTNAAIIEDCLVKISQEEKMTLILVTHDVAQAEKLGGCRLTLRQGRICEL
jgi:tungstate transport system ATP-binding protein